MSLQNKTILNSHNFQMTYRCIKGIVHLNCLVSWQFRASRMYMSLSSKQVSRNVSLKPGFRKCWDVFKIWKKWKLKYFRITWADILFTIEHREHNKCLNWDILHFYPLNELISNLMPATGLKKVGTGQQRAEKARHFWKDSAERTSSN